MKKFIAILCALSMIVSLAACAKQPTQAGSKSSKSGSAASKSASSKISVDYRHKIEKYLYQKNNKDYTANYPQLSPEAPNYQKANDLLKKTGLQNILASGLKKEDATTTIKVKSKLTYYNENFISATFDESNNVSTAAHPSAEFRTVNFDLKNGVPVTKADMIVDSDALNTALLAAAKKQLKSDLTASLTTADIKDGMTNCSIYFSKTVIGFSLGVSHALGDHMEVTLKYADVKPYITTNAIWKNFITE